MGLGGGGGYKKKSTVTSGQRGYLNNALAQAGPLAQQAAEGYRQFLPGGGGGQAIANDANRNFQQNTIPSILNAFGNNASGDVKGSSGLNQALAAGGANLNSSLASLLSQLQLQGAQGAGNLALGQGSLGAGTPQFAYQQRDTSGGPFGGILGGILGSAGGPFGSALGSSLGSRLF